MSWRDKVKAMRGDENSEKCLTPSLTKLTKPGFVSFGSTPPTHFSEKKGFSGHLEASNDSARPEPVSAQNPAQTRMDAAPAPAPVLDPDRWAWPHSEAMTRREIGAFAVRAALFNRRGMQPVNAEELAYKLVSRDREEDDRRLCLECAHLAGRPGAWRCGQWQRAGMGAAGVPAGLVLVPQRCDGFKPTR